MRDARERLGLQQGPCSRVPWHSTISRGRRSRAGPVGGGSEGRMRWPSPLGSPWQQDHHRGSASVPFQGLPQPGRRTGDPAWLGAVGRGPGGGPARPGCCLQALHRAPASPHPSLGPNTEQTGQTRRGTAGRGGEGSASLRPGSKTDTSALSPAGRQRLNSPSDGHITSGPCGKTRDRKRQGELGHACPARLHLARPYPCQRNSME